jgi:uncharacterized membrane protein YdjX (TVP38/TMEM64 family)
MKLKQKNIFYKFPNLIILFNCIVISVLLGSYPPFKDFLHHLGSYSYLGAFIGGILFVNTFTASLAIVILFSLLSDLPLFLISIFAGLGGMIGDLLIFRFMKNNIFTEIKMVLSHIGFKHNSIRAFIRSKNAAWTLPIIGAIIIASPFPDEIGVMMMGLARVKTYKFLLLTFILNTLGIMAVLGLFDAIF